MKILSCTRVQLRHDHGMLRPDPHSEHSGWGGGYFSLSQNYAPPSIIVAKCSQWEPLLTLRLHRGGGSAGGACMHPPTKRTKIWGRCIVYPPPCLISVSHLKP